MRNYIQKGDNVTFPAPSAYLSGDVVVIGDIVGIAAGDAPEDEPLDVVTRGVFRLDKVGANSFSIGDKIYWDATSKLATSVESGNVHIGTCTKIAVSGSASVETKLV